MEAKRQLEAIHLPQLYQDFTGQYTNFVVGTVNESCLRLAVMTGEYRWHRHPDADEMFMILEGELIIDFQDRESVVLTPNTVFTVPANVIHRTRTLQRTVNLCFEHIDAATEFLDNQ